MLVKYDSINLKKELKDELEDLCKAHGVSGFEGDVLDVIKKKVENYSDDIKTDAMGNLIVKKNGNGKLKVMITAHTDEIGLVVKRIDEKGFIWFDVIGGVRPQVLFSRPVIIKTENGYVNGIVHNTKPGRPEGISEVPTIEDFFIEVGARNKKEVEEMGIEVGNPVSMNYEVLLLGKNRVAAKALDDRVCVYMLIQLLKLLKNDDCIPDIYAVFTSQEEVGCRGAKTSAYNINPDMAIALDVSLANDIPDVPDRKIISELDKGPVIKVLDSIKGAILGTISSQRIVKGLKNTAKEANIDHQIEVCTAISTDAATIHMERGGIESGGISIPTRYVHAYEVVSIDDIANCIELLYRYIKSLATGK